MFLIKSGIKVRDFIFYLKKFQNFQNVRYYALKQVLTSIIKSINELFSIFI
jgi:hypothetical protein